MFFFGSYDHLPHAAYRNAFRERTLFANLALPVLLDWRPRAANSSGGPVIVLRPCVFSSSGNISMSDVAFDHRVTNSKQTPWLSLPGVARLHLPLNPGMLYTHPRRESFGSPENSSKKIPRRKRLRPTRRFAFDIGYLGYFLALISVT